MKRYTGQKALYEAISRSRAKAKRGNILERFLPEAARPEEPLAQEGPAPVEPAPPMEAVPPAEPTPPPIAKEPPRPVVEKENERPREPVVVRENAKLRRLAAAEKMEVPPEKPAMLAAKLQPVGRIDRPAPLPGPVQTWWRLKPVQLNAGRVEVSVPYHVGVVVVLVVVLVILVAYRIGQKHPGGQAKDAVPAKAPAQVTKQNAAAETIAPKAASSVPPAASAPASGPAQTQGDHWIVLKYSRQKADLDDAREFFGKNGIDVTVWPMPDVRSAFAELHYSTALLPKGDGFMLVTTNRYNNPESPGTDGNAMKQKIIEVGRKYRPAPGRDSFAPKFFSDAYGMKLIKVGQ